LAQTCAASGVTLEEVQHLVAGEAARVEGRS